MSGAEILKDPVVVVGARIIGVCCASSLLRDGHRVALLDRTALGEGTSFGNGSINHRGGGGASADAGYSLEGPGYANGSAGASLSLYAGATS